MPYRTIAMFLTTDINNATSEIPVYPSTPLIYFPHELAYQISVATYIHIGCLAVIVWDVIDNFKSDFNLLFRHSIKVPTVIYFITRITLLAYMLSRAVLLTLPVADCAKMYDAINALLVIFVSATIAMFYLRVCAVYRMNRYIVISYGILWLGVVAMLMTLPWTFTAAHIATTQYCGEVMHGSFLGPTTVMLMVNDTLIYAGIAYKLFDMFVTSDSPKGSKLSTVLTFGTTLPIVSRALFKDSQLYFMVVIVTNPFIVACVYVFEAPISVMFLVCHLVLVNILSCRVYRNIRLGLAPDFAMPPSPVNPSRHGNGLMVLRRVENLPEHTASIPNDTDGLSMNTTIHQEVSHVKESTTMYTQEPSAYDMGREGTGSLVDVERAQAQRRF